MAHAGGRPTKYDPSICERIIVFFDKDPLEESRFDRKGNLQIGPKPPTFERFAHQEDLNHETLLEWSKDPEKPEFSASYKKAKELQRAFYTEALFAGVTKGAPPIFIAKNETNMVDQQLVDHTNKGEKFEAVDPKSLALIAKYEAELKKKTLE
jgi:hypothetical protein